MEFHQVFITFAIVLVAVLGITGITAFWNTSYNVDIGTGYNNSLSHINTTANGIFNIGNEVGNASYTSSGTGSGSTSSDLIARGLSVVTILPNMIGITPSLIQDASSLLGISDAYFTIAITVFMFGFGLLLAYMLIVGVRRIV